jgi:hypothetical protein
MTIVNRDTLAAEIASYIHRTDLTAEILGFIDLTTKRLGRDLKSLENEKTLDPFTMATNPQVLPADFVTLRELTYESGSGVVFMKAAGLRELARYSGSRAGNNPVYYAVKGRSIQVAPTRLGDFQLTYFSSPLELAAGTDTNAVLMTFPYLYLYAALMEAFFFIQEEKGHQMARANYLTELRAANISAEKARVGTAIASR